jgi:hypothetical protein
MKKTMGRSELFGFFSFLVFSVVSFALLFAPIASAATVGFYAGTFDPPTLAEIGMMRCALGDAGVRKECADIGKTITRLVISVDPSSDGDTLASARERALMVKHALQKYGDRVEVVTAPGSRGEKTRALLENKQVERLIQFIDSASYQALKASQVSQDPRVLWRVFSLKQPGRLVPPLDPRTLPATVKLYVELEFRAANRRNEFDRHLAGEIGRLARAPSPPTCSPKQITENIAEARAAAAAASPE